MSTPQSTNELDFQQFIGFILPEIRNSVRLACSIHRYTAGKAELDDLCQEIAFLLIENEYRRLRSFDHKSSLKTWLRKVVMHYVFHYLQRHRVEVSLERIPTKYSNYQMPVDDSIWFEQARASHST
jgi:RNA polymerase sigma factor (sigma-70 family)